ncbi:hypothetical protein NE237_013728 [Protea cynaroides]|uniref:Uncharacterized protein n=1 Tax=Protea cynaroides TaxID=273540 RepID=A0A9Q0K026_9MAGN|nr:hypothetical protein NE237_013728 [Protea cynaroides]
MLFSVCCFFGYCEMTLYINTMNSLMHSDQVPMGPPRQMLLHLVLLQAPRLRRLGDLRILASTDYKLNCDASIFPDTKRGGLGYIIRYHRGTPLLVVSDLSSFTSIVTRDLAPFVKECLLLLKEV